MAKSTLFKNLIKSLHNKRKKNKTDRYTSRYNVIVDTTKNTGYEF